MPQSILCRYPSYEADTQHDVSEYVSVPIAEQFGSVFRGREKTFEIVTETPELLLNRDVVLDVDQAALGRTAPARFRVEHWTIVVDDAHRTRIELAVRELRPKPLARLYSRLPDLAQDWISGGAAVLLLGGAAFLLYAAMQFPEPGWFWALVARNLQSLGAVALVIVAAVPAIAAFRRFRHPGFARRFAVSLCYVFGLSAVTLWQIASEPAGPLQDTSAAIAYLNALVSSGKAFTPLLLALAPWVIVFTKLLGWDFATSVVSTARGAKSAAD